MPSLNVVMLMGHLTHDPKLRYTQSGVAVANFALAINRVWTNAGGEKQEEVVFVDVTAWKRQAETCAEFLHKGSLALVEGRLRLDQWEKDGQKRQKIGVTAERVLFLHSGEATSDGSGASPSPAAAVPKRPDVPTTDGTAPPLTWESGAVDESDPNYTPF